MITSTLTHIFIFFYKFILIINIVFILFSSTILVITNNTGNIASIKERNVSNFIKNILLVNILTNILFTSTLLYVMLFLYKTYIFELVLFNTKFSAPHNQSNLFFYVFDFDIFNIIFYILSLFVAFISLLALDTRIYSSKNIFLVLCNILVLVIFMFSFTTNYILFFIFYELLLIPSFFFVYRISPAKTAIQSSIYFVM